MTSVTTERPRVQIEERGYGDRLYKSKTSHSRKTETVLLEHSGVRKSGSQGTLLMAEHYCFWKGSRYRIWSYLPRYRGFNANAKAKASKLQLRTGESKSIYGSTNPTKRITYTRFCDLAAELRQVLSAFAQERSRLLAKHPPALNIEKRFDNRMRSGHPTKASGHGKRGFAAT